MQRLVVRRLCYHQITSTYCFAAFSSQFYVYGREITRLWCFNTIVHSYSRLHGGCIDFTPEIVLSESTKVSYYSYWILLSVLLDIILPHIIWPAWYLNPGLWLKCFSYIIYYQQLCHIFPYNRLPSGEYYPCANCHVSVYVLFSLKF